MRAGAHARAEISTGLDSSTTFQIVKCTRNFAQLMKARRRA